MSPSPSPAAGRHDETARHEPAGRRDAWVLAICQGLFTAAISIDLTLTGLTGFQLAPDPTLATLPFAMITVAGALATPLVSFVLQRFGRRAGFALGSFSALVGGLVSVWAVFRGDFWLFCLGTAGVGVFQAFAMFYRLAAADAVAGERKARAVSFVLAGGVVAAVFGPLLAAWSMNLFPQALFAGAYLMVGLLGLVSMLLLLAGYRDVRSSSAMESEVAEPARPLGTVMRQPIFLASIANNVIGSAVMLLVMTAAPIAAVQCHHGIADGANIIQWHMIGMYGPSFFAGALIARFGMPAVLFAGMALNLACVVAAASSTGLPAFYVALFCLGVGWNFMFVGGTTLLAQSYRPSERARVQGVAELIRYVVTAAAALLAGPMLDRYGWQTVNLMVLPMLAVAAVLTMGWVAASRRAVAAEALP